MTSWPPPHHVRESTRAKSVHLKICPQKGLEIVIPSRLQGFCALQFLNEHRGWVEKHHELIIQAKNYQQRPLPSAVSLPAIEQHWKIFYKATTSRALSLHQPSDNLLLLQGCLDDQDKIKKRLQQWLLQQGKQHLPGLLAQMSGQINLPYRHLTIRQQKNRWGSCSSQKDICLNCQLLLLPRNVIDYVLVHELCHTIHCNHSPAFWQLVKSCMPDYKQREMYLKKNAPHYLEKWL